MMNELPSDTISPEDQERIRSQLATLSVLQAAAVGSGNAANIFRPGSVDNSSVNQMAAAHREQIMQPVTQARNARKQAMENANFAAQQQQMQLTNEDRQTKLNQLRASLDPNSDLSRAKQDELRDIYTTRAKMLEGVAPDIAKKLYEAASFTEKKPLTQLLKEEENWKNITGEAMHLVDSKARNELARQGRDLQERGVNATERLTGSTIADRREDNAIQRERLEFDRKKENNKELRAQVKSPPQQLLKDMRETQQALLEVRELMQLEPKVRYMGIGGEGLAQLASKDPTGKLLTKEERRYLALMGKMRAKERKGTYGAALSKYDIGDADTWLPGLGTNREANREKFATMAEGLANNYIGQVRDFGRLSGEEFEPANEDEAQQMERAISAKRQQALRELGGKSGGDFPGASASQPSSKPKRVIQNGHMFELDPVTGKYKQVK